MLNRRILRVKAMQALYSYFTTQESLKVVIREKLESKFYPDPAKDDFADAEKFTVKRKQASELFNNYLKTKAKPKSSEAEPEITNEVNQAISDYSKEITKERSRIKSEMVRDVENIYKLYLKLLQLPVEFSHLEKLEKEKNEKAYIKKETTWKWNLINNTVIEDLTRSEKLNKTIIEEKISWSNQLDTLRHWYKEIIKNDEEFHAYEDKENPSNKEHYEILTYFFKKIIFKNESINESLSEMDLYWSENKPILKSLIVKTIKDYEPDLDSPFELKSVSKNAEEDTDFFKDLYDHSIEKSDDLDKLITNKIKNWDISRVATLDRIILKMALSEMMLFHAIPLKVTINEFIEISKQYSTPKSKQFVNGILDVMANELTSDGVIKKSGRGLIDNK